MADTAVPVFKKRGPKANLRKRPATPPPDANDSDSEYSSDDGTGQRIKRRRKGGVDTTVASTNRADPASLKADAVTAETTNSIATYNDATKQSNWYDEGRMNVKDLLGSTRVTSSSKSIAAPPAADGSYQGSSNYSNFIQKHPDQQDRKFGPVKSSTNVRTITITDYAPDVCKDYKQTGFCGFGDSCKFLHAREDYKQGWALDRDWEINTKGKKVEGKVVASANRDGTGAEDDDAAEAALLEKIPFACIICKKPYTNPIVTKCEHYFCEKCALQRYRKNPNCAACGAGTNGVFNTAKTLGKLLDKKRAREDKAKAEAEEEAKEAT